MELPHAVAALAALAHETRLAAFRVLVEAGPDGLPAGRISDALKLAPSTLSFHLKELTNAGLVRCVQKGRFMIYAMEGEAMRGLLAFLTENCCGGVPCGVEPLAEALIGSTGGSCNSGTRCS